MKKEAVSLFDKIMTIPVFTVLAVIFLIIAVPAFLSFQSTEIGTWEQPFIALVNGVNLRMENESYFQMLAACSAYNPPKELTDKEAEDYETEYDEWSTANSLSKWDNCFSVGDGSGSYFIYYQVEDAKVIRISIYNGSAYTG